jgi:glycosyltransferase involved in cell wall biosynthesis
MIVQDEEVCVARVLSCIHDYVDEIILVDGGSVDRTKEIASSFPKVKIFDIPFPDDFGIARNNSIELASGEWIFIIDADEYCEPYFLRQFGRLISTTEFDAYSFVRLTVIDGNLYNIFADNDDRTYRLFRNHCRYSGKLHEQVHNIRNSVKLNMYIVHDKTSVWQQKDNEKFWRMGQEMPTDWFYDKESDKFYKV